MIMRQTRLFLARLPVVLLCTRCKSLRRFAATILLVSGSAVSAAASVLWGG
jgi:hypothetical protein